MFKDLFKKMARNDGKKQESVQTEDIVFDALKRAIEEQRKDDPLIGAKIGGKEITQRLINAMKTDKGVHIESLLCALGAIAGYACQASIRAEFIDIKGMPEDQVFMKVGCADGKEYYFGDLLNKPLAENQHSVWSLAGGAAQELGSKELIDLKAVFEYVAGTIGGDNFGIPRIPEKHKPADLPVNFVNAIWPKLLPIVKQFCIHPANGLFCSVWQYRRSYL